MKGIKGLFVSLLAGIGIGSAATYMANEKNRKNVIKKYNETKDDIMEKADELKEKYEDTKETIKAKTEEIKNEVDKKIEDIKEKAEEISGNMDEKTPTK